MRTSYGSTMVLLGLALGAALSRRKDWFMVKDTEDLGTYCRRTVRADLAASIFRLCRVVT